MDDSSVTLLRALWQRWRSSIPPFLSISAFKNSAAVQISKIVLTHLFGKSKKRGILISFVGIGALILLNRWRSIQEGIKQKTKIGKHAQNRVSIINVDLNFLHRWAYYCFPFFVVDWIVVGLNSVFIDFLLFLSFLSTNVFLCLSYLLCIPSPLQLHFSGWWLEKDLAQSGSSI